MVIRAEKNYGIFRRFEMKNFVLFAEDDMIQARVLDLVCKRLGLSASDYAIVSNGLEAISYLERSRAQNSSENKPELVISDLRMPLMDGLDLLTRLRETDAFKTVPVFILTAIWEKKDEMVAKELGCCGFFEKPAGLYKMEELVKQILGM